MCGRYAVTLAPEGLARLLGALGHAPRVPARFNAAPGQSLPVVRRRRGGGREIVPLRWGLVPSWSKGPDARFSMINARAETVATKPAYRGAFRHRRCLVPASGFFEWQAVPGGKRPWYFASADGAGFAFAGLWEYWAGAGGDEIESFAVVVTDANARVAPVHDRMPAILAPEDHGRWLGEEDLPLRAVETLLKPCPAEWLTAWPVGTRVNSPANDDPSLIEPVPDEPQARLL